MLYLFFLMTYDVILYMNTSECWNIFPHFSCFSHGFEWFGLPWKVCFHQLEVDILINPLQLSMPGHPRCLPTSYPPDSESRGVEGKKTFFTCEFLQNNM